MTTSPKREAAHHNAAARPAQKGDHRGATVSADGAGDLPTESEALAPVQPRAPPPRKIIRADEVCKRLGKSRTQIWRDVRDGKMPAPVQLGPNSIGWFDDEIGAHQESLPRVSYAPGPKADAA